MSETQILQAFELTLYEVREVVDKIIHEKLSPINEFSIDGSKEWSQHIGNDIKEKLKEMGTDPNYKYWVSVVIGQLKGQGVEVSSHCAWDANTDHTISSCYANDALYWFVLVFTVYKATPELNHNEAEGEVED